ncbi:MAG: SidE phosphodiesterase domain-containing protein [Pseudomonadota bacterium]|nr:SidE phosphodiesterase domain-containing protein [Pseudomonadota bacterium]
MTKLTIPLAKQAAQDNQGKDISGHFKIDSRIATFKIFWKQQNSKDRQKSFADLVGLISRDIMEQGYTENPKQGNIVHHNETAFHVNHSTCHAIRQSAYQDLYFESIKRHGANGYKEAALSFSHEEYAIMRLAGIIHRAARTNEQGFPADKRYGERCSQVFEFVATQLGFNSELIQFVQNTMNTYQDSSQIQQQDQEQVSQDPKGIPSNFGLHARKKAILFERILMMGHSTDLVRCWGPKKESEVVDAISSRLKDLADFDSRDMTKIFLSIGEDYCRMTGNQLSLLHRENYNPALAVSSAKHAENTFNTLEAAKQRSLLKIHIARQIQALEQSLKKLNEQHQGLSQKSLEKFIKKLTNVVHHHSLHKPLTSIEAALMNETQSFINKVKGVKQEPSFLDKIFKVVLEFIHSVCVFFGITSKKLIHKTKDTTHGTTFNGSSEYLSKLNLFAKTLDPTSTVKAQKSG